MNKAAIDQTNAPSETRIIVRQITYMKAVVYDFCESRSGGYARTFQEAWKGTLVGDDFAGYK